MKEVGPIKLYSIEDLSKMLGLTPRTLRGWFSHGKFKGKGVKIGKEWHLSEENLTKILQGN